MSENLIYLVGAIIFGWIIGTCLLYVLYLKQILPKRDLKRGIANASIFAIFGIIIFFVFLNFDSTSSAIVAIICLILWIFTKQIVKKKIQ
ncbi:membrane hypothetical protein [groundwater metagenome]|uniref:Uncharacterized protein n=1 Tax=groundwater metagenome TaxID=717931 RepID=A0A098EAK0_9ZZZZ